MLHAILKYFVDLCLLRKGPQDLPASSVLLGFAWMANLVVGILLVQTKGSDPSQAFTESLVDSLFMLAVLWLALYLQTLSARFLQSATALMGSGALLSLIALPIVSVVNSLPAGQEGGAWIGLLLIGLVIWSIVVMGHIIRHSFNLPIRVGIAFAFGYTLVSYTFMFKLFGGQ